MVREVRYPAWWCWCLLVAVPQTASQEIAHGTATTGSRRHFPGRVRGQAGPVRPGKGRADVPVRRSGRRDRHGRRDPLGPAGGATSATRPCRHRWPPTSGSTDQSRWRSPRHADARRRRPEGRRGRSRSTGSSSRRRSSAPSSLRRYVRGPVAPWRIAAKSGRQDVRSPRCDLSESQLLGAGREVVAEKVSRPTRPARQC